jgi:hypothetical protein
MMGSIPDMVKSVIAGVIAGISSMLLLRGATYIWKLELTLSKRLGIYAFITIASLAVVLWCYFETFVELRDFFANTLKKLKGSDKRTFCAELALRIGHGGQSLVAKELCVSRKTIRKGIQEVKSGIVCLDAYNLRHRPPIEKKLPHLLEDIQSILDSQSQTYPRFKTKRLYARITVRELIKQLIGQKGYSDDELPTNSFFQSFKSF